MILKSRIRIETSKKQKCCNGCIDRYSYIQQHRMLNIITNRSNNRLQIGVNSQAGIQRAGMILFRKGESLMFAPVVLFPFRFLLWRFIRHDGRLTPEEARFHILPANKTFEFVARVHNPHVASDANIDQDLNHHRPQSLCPHVYPRACTRYTYIRGIIIHGVIKSIYKLKNLLQRQLKRQTSGNY